MISIHSNTRDLHDHKWYGRGWKEAPTKDAREVARYIVRYANSAIVWKDGRRLTDNFAGADWAVLDVDGGATIQEAIKLYGDYEHVIGTTKSHQKQKGSEGPRDRYRLWIRLDTRCMNHKDYRETLRQLGKKIGADEQAYDAARKFLPCNKIVHGKNEGKRAPILKFVEPVVEKKDLSALRKGFIPAFVKQWLTSGAPEGERNKACFKVGLYLGRNGWKLEDIKSIAMQSNLPNGMSSEEAAEAITSGFKRSR